MEKIIGRIHSVETFGAVDGPGVRYVLFVQGCRLRCLYCHNPDTWDMRGGCEISTDEVVEDVKSYYNFIKAGGFTLSGGEPLLQPRFTLDLIRKIKAIGLHTAIDTAGSVPLEHVREIIEEADLLLLDVKTADPGLLPELVGVSFVGAADILAHREKIGKPVWIRHVLVPGYTLDTCRDELLADFLAPYSCIERVELLPFHKMGEYKWESLGLDYKLYDVDAPARAEVEASAEVLRSRGLEVFVK